MFDLIAQVLAFFYSLVPSYGVAIVLLTLAVMIVVTPLTLKSTRSMLQMQRLQPELKAIQTRYKDDRQKMKQTACRFRRATIARRGGPRWGSRHSADGRTRQPRRFACAQNQIESLALQAPNLGPS